MNAIVWADLELVYYNVVVQIVNHYAMRTLSMVEFLYAKEKIVTIFLLITS